MTVTLDTLVDSVKRAVNPPGADLFPNAYDDEWVGRLADAFSDARMRGLFVGYHLTDTLDGVDPDPGVTDEFPSDKQRIVVLYAAYRAVRSQVLNMNVSTHAKAGPVEFDSQRGASVLVQVWKDIAAEIEQISVYYFRIGQPTYVGFLDMVTQRDAELRNGDITWVRG